MPTPSEQLLTRTVYATDGVTTNWDFSFSGGYLDKSHVKAFTEATTGERTEIIVTEAMIVGPFQVRIVPALAAGLMLTVYRDTPKDLPLVDFTDESGFSEIALDTNAKQAVFIAAETTDTVNTSSSYDAEQAASLAATAAAAAQVSANAAAASALLAANEADAAAASAVLSAASAVSSANSAASSSAAATTVFNDNTTAYTRTLLDDTSAAAARATLGAAASGANSDITSLTGLTTPLSMALGGTGMANGFVSVKTASGYQRLPSGLIIQWGSGSFPSSGSQTQSVTYPISFPTAALQVIVGNYQNSDSLGGLVKFRDTGSGLSSFTAYCQDALGSITGFKFIAIGY